MKNQYVLGALFNAAFMLCIVLAYQLLFRELVVRVGWAGFLGQSWFFALESLILPLIFYVQGKKKLCLGGLIGIVIYFLSLPIAFIHGD